MFAVRMSERIVFLMLARRGEEVVLGSSGNNVLSRLLEDEGNRGKQRL